jgi:hypothetical protein
MTKKDLQKLRKSMPPKYRHTLATQFDVTSGYIDQVFRGEKNSISIIDAAIELAAAHKQYLAEQKLKISEL